MKYDDLLNIPFVKFGRDKNGYDCYGVVMECCRRAGTPLKDLYNGIVDLPPDQVNDYISEGLNVRPISTPKIGSIIETQYHGNVHVGYVVDRGLLLHATYNKGVQVSPLAVFKILGIYEVINEGDTI